MNRSKTRIFIGGMTCVNCQNKIETALLHTAGIGIDRSSYQNRDSQSQLSEWYCRSGLRSRLDYIGGDPAGDPGRGI